MIHDSDKRGFTRMHVQCPISMLEHDSAAIDTGELLDLSASGVRFISPRALQAGARLQITVPPGRPITPPLEANVSVLRCQEVDYGFDIAASIDTIEPPEYPESS